MLAFTRVGFALELVLQKILPDLKIPVEQPVKQSGHKLVPGLVSTLAVKSMLHGHIALKAR